MFARFDENPAKQNITDGRTDGRTHGQRENSIPTTNKTCWGYNYSLRFELASKHSHGQSLHGVGSKHVNLSFQRSQVVIQRIAVFNLLSKGIVSLNTH